MIPIFDDDEQIIGEVESNRDLDYWDGNNYTCGSTGRHKGLAIFNEDYVLIHTTQWQGERDTAEIITADRAVQEILKSGNTELFSGYPELQALREDINQGRKKDLITFRIDKEVKNRWQGIAEAEGKSLTDWTIGVINNRLSSIENK